MTSCNFSIAASTLYSGEGPVNERYDVGLLALY